MKWRYALYAVSIAGLGWAVIFGDPPASAVSEPARPPQSGHRELADDQRPLGRGVRDDEVLALVPRARIVSGVPDVVRSTAFAATDWSSPASSAASATGPVAPAELPFTYVGRQRIDGGWQVFVSSKDDAPIRTRRAGDAVDDQYQVVSITDDTMVVDYLPLHTQYSIPLE